MNPTKRKIANMFACLDELKLAILLFGLERDNLRTRTEIMENMLMYIKDSGLRERLPCSGAIRYTIKRIMVPAGMVVEGKTKRRARECLGWRLSDNAVAYGVDIAYFALAYAVELKEGYYPERPFSLGVLLADMKGIYKREGSPRYD